MKRKDIKTLLLYVVIIVIIAVILAPMFDGVGSQEIPQYDDVVKYFTDGEVTEFFISVDNILTMKLKNGDEVVYQIASLELFHRDLGELITQQMAQGSLKGEYEPNTTSLFATFLPLIIIGVIIVGLFIWYFASGAANAGTGNGKGGPGGRMNSFGRARVKTPSPDEKDRVLFRDVAGADEEKEELAEMVEFLKNPAKFTKLGAKIPHGVLLVGPPGTGKTLLAKAVAGEAGVPFFSLSGSDFVEMYVGVGASRVRDLFETARKAPASIIFIDEIDAVGRHRGAGLGGGHDEREQTLNQLLVEMDGFGSHDGVIVIAATNRPDILDPALLRPGRFDRHVTVNYPDIRGREEILQVHARKKPMEPDVDYRKIAQTTVGFTGADLANLLNEAALLAARRSKELIGMDEIDDAFMKMILGPKKKAKVRNEHDNRLVAYHEAGHATISWLLRYGNPLVKVTIVPRGIALGAAWYLPEERQLTNKEHIMDNLCSLLGGRAAEEVFLKQTSTGALNDLERATKQAYAMVAYYGMSDKLKNLSYYDSTNRYDLGITKPYSEKTAEVIDAETSAIIAAQMERAKKILEENAEGHNKLAEMLIEKEVITSEDVESVLGPRPWKSREDEIIAANDAVNTEKSVEDVNVVDTSMEENQSADTTPEVDDTTETNL
jgi:cell division protease FtsH